MSRYPILVERYDRRHPAYLVVCERCDGRQVWDPGEGDPSDMCAKCDCGGQLVYLYEEAERCGGCGDLGHYEHVLEYCCSRRCMLQKQYAAELEARNVA